MNLSRESIEITKRFFEAIDMLRAQRRIRGLQTFTRTYGLNYGNTYQIKKYPESNVLKPECLTYICRDFGISTEWLILGKGGMFID